MEKCSTSNRPELNDRIENAFHDVGIDQVALGFDHF